MEKDAFCEGEWWLTAQDGGPEVVEARHAIAEHQGWDPDSWFSDKSNLEELYELIESSAADLLTELEEAVDENSQKAWLDKVVETVQPAGEGAPGAAGGAAAKKEAAAPGQAGAAAPATAAPATGAAAPPATTNEAAAQTQAAAAPAAADAAPNTAAGQQDGQDAAAAPQAQSAASSAPAQQAAPGASPAPGHAAPAAPAPASHAAAPQPATASPAPASHAAAPQPAAASHEAAPQAAAAHAAAAQPAAAAPSWNAQWGMFLRFHEGKYEYAISNVLADGVGTEAPGGQPDGNWHPDQASAAAARSEYAHVKTDLTAIFNDTSNNLDPKDLNEALADPELAAAIAAMEADLQDL